MDDNTAIITLRIDKNLKTAFERIGKELDQTTSQLLRRYIKQVVAQHAESHAQGEIDLSPISPPSPTHKKPAKGQKMAFVKHQTGRG